MRYVISIVRPSFPATLAAALLAVGLVVGNHPASSGQSWAAEADGPLLKLRTERVIVFKDGYALVLKRGTAVTNDAGEMFLDQVPDAAVLGSFWATPSEGRLVSMVAGWEERQEEREKDVTCTSPLEVLKANVGRSCRLTTSDNLVLEGTILTVLAHDVVQPADSNARAVFASGGLSSRQAQANSNATAATAETITALAGTQFVLRTETGDVLLGANEIRRLSIEDMKTTLPRTLTTNSRAKRLTFRFEKPGQSRELLIAYFRPGLRWIPTYRIDLAGNMADDQHKRATISMQAELLNEAEDLHDTSIDIVVGVPNFRFRDTPSPLVLESVLRNTIQQAAPQLSQQFALTNAFTNSAYGAMTGDARQQAAAGGGQPLALPGELTASGSQDLFVYNLPKLNLNKGERAAVPIFTATAPYRDVYTWDLHLRRSDIATSPAGQSGASPLDIQRNEVWRQIELTNNSNLPWTTGAAMITDGHQPLAQEMLTYTSTGDRVRVPVTVAVDVRGTHHEVETGRELQALQWRHNNYARIEQRAQLNVCNHKPQPIDLEITMRFGGTAGKASHEGSLSLAPYREVDWSDYQGDRAVNNSSTVRWKATLAAGQIFEPTVDYHFHTRH